ncbi:hypothetical protein CHGG_01089 [Chaetomium globosum CBS 148.51]|uniref:DUF7053 domain-containing protein n=1 Tax=Chaetomium globosum (strain ATCC 6205 / CBS 148.51 / DSM 1962 / NBRC 6347 / NRRL 1970) TaxID=306901 RepID=Q2HFB5_CHAGB|nr:uncharacterized protein CHGG_01089 [Chaetomium globosum CBS 148.51]EAQ92854.1 hypothetical protein CHGG_01089 [Chaetomium globosum CBS 148.51]
MSSKPATKPIALLSDHDFFLTCDPHLTKAELIPRAEYATLNPPPAVPDHVKPELRARPQPSSNSSSGSGSSGSSQDEGEAPETVPECYRVTDIVHAIPAGIWDTNVVSVFEITDIEDGWFVRIRSPLSVVMETFWRVREVAGAGAGAGESGGEGDEGGEGEAGPGLELVEEITISCSRLLMGIVKSQCENDWKQIHGKMVARLVGEGEK